ncbi:helix-turn-helix transcriptional regulator [Alkalicoccus luteus]|uniref:Transcription regulator PadR N-terminal domain-containing protein n=1 Tax=Alkalicoccus luteus TaxID=1237094 RepID=A0A969PQI9_9BACI|nr:helix-turn-helix transcriptional regulator [Alkalicoccus luteus]NJP37543.1 hypothetical protein [Alkalicoccus luteus]
MKNKLHQSYMSRLSFSENRRLAVKSAIKQKQTLEWEDFQTTCIRNILLSLKQEPKDGFALSTSLLKDLESPFRHQEADIYTLLHLLEEKGWIKGRWDDHIRIYRLTFMGKLTADRLVKGKAKTRTEIKQLIRMQL